MSPRTRPRRLAAATCAATLAAVLLAGCGAFGDDSQDAAPPKQKEPTPTGTGPYPDPATPSEAAPLPSGKAGEPKGGIPSPADVDEKDATAVSRAALTALTTYDTAIDTSRNDAGIRVAEAGWCTAVFEAQLRSAVSRSAPGAVWETWAKHQAYTRPKLEQTKDAGQPADTDTAAYRQWTITVTPTGRDGWKGTPEANFAFVELTRADQSKPWRLNTATVQ
ncbi:hypothetical protein [Streptomyces sp. NPDC057199]|uniref:hypothetical protein n=1 Tax=Streptomyces sp. NPDC057199 TaxID=3346047 RepID=UPI00363FF7DD